MPTTKKAPQGGASAGRSQATRYPYRCLLIATSNLGKLGEFRELLAPLRIPLEGLGEHRAVKLPEETGRTYAENAILKAEAACKTTRLPALADDSGIEVAVLGGRPGLFSARFAKTRRPGEAQDAANRRVLLEALALSGTPQTRWRAMFRCALAYAVPGVPTRLFFGEIPGMVVAKERGKGGFGYDPILFLPAYQRTFAELDDAEKNRISHRARAARALLGAIWQDTAGA